ncbi:MAG: magnesium transporter [Clostridia bacterium]|nr:magnesium transporter [Clostridia bacterium]
MDFSEDRAFLEQQDRDYRRAILSIIRGDSSDELMRSLLEDYHANDIAAVLEELSEEENEKLLRVLGNEAMAEIVAYLDDASEIIEQMDADDAAEIIEQMDADEALEVLDTLDEETRQEVLELIEDEVKQEIELIDSYGDDEFGSVMSTNFIAISRELSVKGAMRKLIAEAPENDNIFTIFVVDGDGAFYGAINLKELIVARSDKPLEDLIYNTFPYVLDKESISENIERVRGYSEELIPVLSEEDHRILGVITSHDVTEIVDAELGEDYAKLAALGSEENVREPVFKSMKKRIPWLIALLFLGLAVSAVVGLFEGVVKELPLIVSFQSLILGMAGNVGTQSLAVTVRAVSSDELDGGKFRFIFKETRVAFFNGALIGLFSFVVVGIYLSAIGGHPASLAFSAAACVGLALCFAMMISGFTGAAIPMCFHKLGIDPAIASGPLITTVNDLVAVVSYYGLAWILLINFGV